MRMRIPMVPAMRKISRHHIFILLYLFLVSTENAGLRAQSTWFVGPGDDYTAILERLQPGDELILHEGVYEGNAIIGNSGSFDKPITIRGYGNGENRPVLLWKGTNTNLLQINGNNLILEFLEFRALNTYAIRIGHSNAGNCNIIIRNCMFFESGGGDISVNASAVYDNIKILDNCFIGPKKTPVYIGQHEGKAGVTNFVFRGNIIDGSQISGDNIIGYGIQLKLNVTGGIIENNYITGTKGPGIMVYGAENQDPRNANIVRNKIVTGSRNSPGIVVGGGPSTVTGNLVIGCPGGISNINYGNRNLHEHIVLEKNTAVMNSSYGISFGNAGDISARDNLVITSDTLSGFASDRSPGFNNNIEHASGDLEIIVRERLPGPMPARHNLDRVWLRLSSGPLDQSGVVEILNLILE
jgi:hypothetical protein